MREISAIIGTVFMAYVFGMGVTPLYHGSISAR